MAALPNLILIGMPGAGKSTVGKLFAKLNKMGFVDTDALIESAEGTSLQNIVDNQGYIKLRALESKHLLALDCSNSLVSTGGSAVYSSQAMRHLSRLGTIVYLSATQQELEKRITNQSTRGLAKPTNQSFTELYQERTPLYQRYSNKQIETKGLTPSQVCDLLAPLIVQHSAPNQRTT